MPLSNHDFLSSFPYHVLVDGEPGAGFTECSGLAAGQSQKAGNVTLGRVAIATTEFFDWVMQHSAGRDLRVVLYDESHEPVENWQLSGARVVKVTATTFTGKGFPFRVEALELSVESVTAAGKL
jgi:phage tail-like protein